MTYVQLVAQKKSAGWPKKRPRGQQRKPRNAKKRKRRPQCASSAMPIARLPENKLVSSSSARTRPRNALVFVASKNARLAPIPLAPARNPGTTPGGGEVPPLAHPFAHPQRCHRSPRLLRLANTVLVPVAWVEDGVPVRRPRRRLRRVAALHLALNLLHPELLPHRKTQPKKMTASKPFLGRVSGVLDVEGLK